MTNLVNLKTKNIWAVGAGGVLLAGVCSQTLLDFFSLILGFAFIYDFVKTKPNLKELFSVKISWVFFAYFIVVVLGFIFNATAPLSDIVRELLKFLWVPTLFIYVYAINKINFQIEKIFFFFCWAYLIPNLYAVSTYFAKYDFLTQVDLARVVGFLNSSTYHAHANALVFVAFCSFSYFYFANLSRRLRVFVTLSLILYFFSIFLTLTRGVWISIFVSALIMFSLISMRKALYVFLCALILLFSMVVFSPALRNRLNPETSQASSSERINLLKVNLQMWKEYPLLGIGYGENMRRNREYWDRPEWNMPKNYITSHAHNQYINVLSTTGIFGLFFFLWFFLYFIVLNYKLLKKVNLQENKFFYGSLFSCLWVQLEFAIACLTDVGFEYAKIRALYIFFWAALLVLKYRIERSEVHELVPKNS